jgi:hypothetical protein
MVTYHDRHACHNVRKSKVHALHGPVAHKDDLATITKCMSQGLIPTYSLATFYSGLAMGQSLLALGAWDGCPGCWMQILPIASVLSFVIIAGSGVSCTNAARGAENEISGDPNLTYEDCIQFLPFIPAFVTLGLATVFIFIKSKTLTSLVIGIGSSPVLTKTGWRWLHVPTAGGFFGPNWSL